MNLIQKIFYVFLLQILVCYQTIAACDSIYYTKYFNIAQSYQNQHQHQKVIALVDSVVILTRNNEGCKFVLNLLHLKGLALEHSQKFEESSALLKQLIGLAQRYRMPEIEAKSYLTLVRLHDFLKREGDLRRNLQNAKKLIDNYNLHHLLPEYYVRASSYQRFFGSGDSSLYYAQQAIVWGEKNNDYLNLADAHFLLSTHQNDTNEQVKSNLKSAEYFKRLGSNSSVALQYINVIRSLNNKSKLGEVEKYIDSERVYVSNLEKTPRVYDIHEYLSKLISEKYEKIGKVDSAIFYIKLASSYRDSSHFVTNDQFISEKEVEIATLKEKARVIELTKSRKFWILGFLVTLISILILGFLYGRNLKYQQKISVQKDQILAQKDELDKLLANQTVLLSEVHHRIKNNLQVVIGMLTLIGRKTNDQKVVQTFNDMSMKIRSISLIHEQLYSKNQFDLINVESYIQQLVNQFEQMNTINGIKFQIKISDALAFNLDTLFPIGIIFTELIINSIKHATVLDNNTLLIQIEILENGGKYMLSYSDNGSGKMTDNIALGTNIVQSMARQLNSKGIEYNDHGYHFQLEFYEKIVAKLNTK
ncbi:MAG: sensor histidine kinase [Saprospiraceae bacterium]|nr:sensor histidine kinase [Saprospiraceae bacterium]